MHVIYCAEWSVTNRKPFWLQTFAYWHLINTALSASLTVQSKRHFMWCRNSIGHKFVANVTVYTMLVAPSHYYATVLLGS